MQKALIETASGTKVNIVDLPDGWTGAPGEWQVPAGHHLGDDVMFGQAGTPPTTITYEAFQNRFTAAEFNAATDFVYEMDLVTGKPKRRALIQGLSRAMAKGHVDLTDPKTTAFLDALVAGGIITSQKKTAILTP